VSDGATIGHTILTEAGKSLAFQNAYVNLVTECESRSRSIANRILKCEALMHIGESSSICFRGSFARNEALNCSDVDLACITEQPTFLMDEKMRQSISGCMSRDVSVHGFNVSFKVLPLNAIVQWTTFNCVKFILGSNLQFKQFLHNGNIALATLEIADLRKLYLLDPLLDIQSEYSPSERIGGITRGIGGVVEFEIAELCARWEKLKSVSINKHSDYLHRIIRECHRFVLLYKYSISAGQSDEFREIVNDRTCTAVRKLAHEKFLELLF
jgi:predicted nucleotidyltransferase